MAHVQMLRPIGVMWAHHGLLSDDISNHKKRRKNLIINLCHRQALLLTRPVVLLGEGRPDTREWRKSSLSSEWLCKQNRLRPEPIRFVRLTLTIRKVTGSPSCWTWSEVVTKRSKASGDQNGPFPSIASRISIAHNFTRDKPAAPLPTIFSLVLNWVINSLCKIK